MKAALVFDFPVTNVDGLWKALANAHPPFSVVSVGADARRTFIWLGENETKDPAPFVEDWADRRFFPVDEGTPVAEAAFAEKVQEPVTETPEAIPPPAPKHPDSRVMSFSTAVAEGKKQVVFIGGPGNGNPLRKLFGK